MQALGTGWLSGLDYQLGRAADVISRTPEPGPTTLPGPALTPVTGGHACIGTGEGVPLSGRWLVPARLTDEPEAVQSARMQEISRRRALSSISSAGIAGIVATRPGGAGPTGARLATRPVPGTVLWRRQAGGSAAGQSPAIVAGYGMVYEAGSMEANGDARIYAIAAATGALAWRTPGYQRPGQASPACPGARWGSSRGFPCQAQRGQ